MRPFTAPSLPRRPLLTLTAPSERILPVNNFVFGKVVRRVLYPLGLKLSKSKYNYIIVIKDTGQKIISSVRRNLFCVLWSINHLSQANITRIHSCLYTHSSSSSSIIRRNSASSLYFLGLESLLWAEAARLPNSSDSSSLLITISTSCCCHGDGVG